MFKIIKHNGIVHNPLGGGSYIFGENFIEYIISNLTKNKIRISIGAQPNSSPHFGTLVVFSLAFALAKKLSENKKEVIVFFEVVDTAPDKTIIINNIKYQKSLRESLNYKATIKIYNEILSELYKYSNIKYLIRTQKEFNSLVRTKKILNNIIENKERIIKLIDPQKAKLRIRVACPKCGLSDKYSTKTNFTKSEIISYCPEHGEYRINYRKEIKKIEYNTPLRNLIRGLLYSAENLDTNIDYEWIRLTGGDYAGFYQEQLLYKTASILGVLANDLPLLIYAPLITDWSGAKLSKSLYVRNNAYSYLPKYIINYDELKNTFGNQGLKCIYLEMENWINNPYKLFRNYSVYYFINLFEEKNE